MSAPFTIVTLFDEDYNEFPIRLPGVYLRNEAADFAAALQIGNEQIMNGQIEPCGEFSLKGIEYHD